MMDDEDVIELRVALANAKLILMEAAIIINEIPEQEGLLYRIGKVVTQIREVL